MFEHPFPRLERALDVPARRSGGASFFAWFNRCPEGVQLCRQVAPSTRRRLERDKLRTSFQAAAIYNRLTKQILGRAAGDEVE